MAAMAATESMTESTSAAMLSIFSYYLTPFNYLLFLALSLFIFVGYLILPRGLRAQYCGAARRRYRRQRRRVRKASQQPNNNPPPLPKYLPPEGVLDNIYAYSHSFSPHENGEFVGSLASSHQKSVRSEIISTQASAQGSVSSGVDESQHGSEISSLNTRDKQQLSLPQQLRMMLQQPPGIKFRAHGTKCRPRPVWITLHCDKISSPSATVSEYRNCLTWRAEIKASSSPSPNKSSPMTPSVKLGNLRKVELLEVLGVELGKRTTALRRVQTTTGVNETNCFSLLTKTGTLDLECTGVVVAGSNFSAEEVRAAFVTCLAMAMSSKGLKLNGLHPMNSPLTLGSQLQSLNNGSPFAPMDEWTMFSGLMTDAKTTSTVSF